MKNMIILYLEENLEVNEDGLIETIQLVAQSYPHKIKHEHVKVERFSIRLEEGRGETFRG